MPQARPARRPCARDSLLSTVWGVAAVLRLAAATAAPPALREWR
ncbi:hypothetical protein [Catellatospora paridis]